MGGGDARAPASHRLAFRELGLALGAEAARIVAAATRGRLAPPSSDALALILPYAPFPASPREFWAAPQARTSSSWRAHEDINDVMLATCLVPAGYLVLRPLPAAG